MEMKVALMGIRGQFTVDARSGIGRYMSELWKNLGALNNKDFQSRRVEIDKMPLLPKSLSFGVKTFVLNLNEYDITHVLAPTPFLRPKVLRDNILITTVHDLHPLLHPEEAFPGGFTVKDRIWLEVVFKAGFQYSDYLISDSVQTKEEAASVGFDKNKIFVSSLGVDKRYSAPLKKKRNKKFTVGYVGGLGGRKNIGFVVKAMNEIKDETVEFDAWGGGDDGHLLTISKNKNTKFMGFAPESSLVKTYDGFDVFAFPSFHEGFGLTILEAQARGLPVIIYKKALISKEVRKYCLEAATPSQMAHQIMELKRNGYNEKMRNAAMLYARSFTWKKNAASTLEIYKKVMGSQ